MTSCYTNDPGFVDAANGDYRLASGSPCIDAGDNAYVTTATDLAGNARIANGTVDIGCYEYGSAAVKAKYLVVDLSGGPDAATWPVEYMDGEPAGGFNTDEYKTTKLVLRRIEPGTFMMGGSYETTLTKPYYMGVFEVTQKQYELVTGSNPAEYEGDMRPVEEVSWMDIRGNTNWPVSSIVSMDSFMGRIRARTGLSFDLPTEAQWEYACRAGTTSNYNNGGSTEEDLKKLGRYSGNQSDGKGGYSSNHTTVGSYLPNAWGLYDMHGNVWEWCLDWKGDLADGEMNPVGASQGSERVLRGGSYYWSAGSGKCTASYRDSGIPLPGALWDRGFRLAAPCGL